MRLLIAVLLTLSLANCGWHLRGVMPLPEDYQVLFLNSSAGSQFDQQLKLQLQFNKVQLVDQAANAPAQLHIQPLLIERRTLSVASTGQVSEYELNARLNARLLHANNDTDLSIEVKARRLFRNDINNIIGTAGEEQKQRSELEKELARKLLRRLQKARTVQGESN